MQHTPFRTPPITSTTIANHQYPSQRRSFQRANLRKSTKQLTQCGQRYSSYGCLHLGTRLCLCRCLDCITACVQSMDVDRLLGRCDGGWSRNVTSFRVCDWLERKAFDLGLGLGVQGPTLLGSKIPCTFSFGTNHHR